MTRINWRGALAALPLPMLALAASYGVYTFNALFVPAWVALVSAAAFELTYVALAVVRTTERRRATVIAVSAVVVSVLYNTLAGLFHIRPALLDARVLWADVALAVLHGLPLAVVAYNVSVLLLHAPAAHEAAPLAHGTRGRRRTVRGLVAALRESRAAAAAMTEAAAQARDVAARAVGEAARLREAARAAEERAAQATGIDARTVAQWLTEAGVSQRQAAQRVGVSESTLRGWLKAAAQTTAQAAD